MAAKYLPETVAKCKLPKERKVRKRLLGLLAGPAA
jgi:hypothetical protein